MAVPGQLEPPDPGGPQKASTAGPSNGRWPPLEGQARSFAAVAKAPNLSRFPKISLAARQYGVKDGKPAISFSSAELKAGEDNLRFTLVAKFSQGRPHIDDIRKAFLPAWKLNNNCSIGAWDARHILIVLDNEGEARKILAHPLRKIGHSLFRVFRWSKDFNLKKEPSTMSTWIRLPSLPPQMYNPGFIESIVNSFGRFLAVDNRTISFSNPSFARACVELDTTSKLSEAVWVSTAKDEGFWQGIEYENKLLFCSKCKLHGHALSNCRKLKRKHEADQRIWAARDDSGLPTGAPTTMVPKDTPAPSAPSENVKAIDADTSRQKLPNQASSQSCLLKDAPLKSTHIGVNSSAPAALCLPQSAPAATIGACSVVLPPTEKLGHTAQEWILVQKKKRKNKQSGKGISQDISKMDDHACNTLGSAKEKDNFVVSTLTCQMHKPSNDGPSVKEGPTLMKKMTLGETFESVAPVQLQVSSQGNGTKYAFPPLTFLRRTKDMDTAINKSCTPGASQKNLSITKSPRSACRRSPPVILLPRSYCLPLWMSNILPFCNLFDIPVSILIGVFKRV